MATGVYSWSQTAASNGSADSNINWQEGQSAPSVNNSARAQMAEMAKWRDDLSGVRPSNVVLTSAGTDTLTVTTNSSAQSYVNGWTITFKAGGTNTGPATLNVDSLGAKDLRKESGEDLAASEIQQNCVYTATYHQPGDEWMIHTAPIAPSAISEGSWTPELLFGGSNTGMTYNAGRKGYYWKNGNFVVATARIYLSSKGSSTGNATITGLPFPVENVAAPVLFSNRLDVDEDFTRVLLLGRVDESTSIIDLFKSTQAAFELTGDAEANNENFANGSDFCIQVMYTTS